LDVGDRVWLAGRDIVRLGLDPERERGAREDAPQRELDARVERAVRAALLVERHQSAEILLVDRAPIRSPRQGRENLTRAARLFLGIGRGAREDAASARRIARAARRERPRDRQGL